MRAARRCWGLLSGSGGSPAVAAAAAAAPVPQPASCVAHVRRQGPLVAVAPAHRRAACAVAATAAAGPQGRSAAASLSDERTAAAGAAQSGLLPVVYHPLYSAPQLSGGHRFPMGVFRRIYERLLLQGVVTQQQIHVPDPVPTDAQLLRVHDPDYLRLFSSGQLDDARTRRIGFGETTRAQVLVDRTKAEVAGTLLTARLALRHGVAVNCAGGTHHAYPDFGSGYCILNDLAVTAEALLAEGLVTRVLILDLDVHQGDGTAYIFRGRPDVFTLSVHCESNFPARKQASTLDVGLPDGTDDAAYLSQLGRLLPEVLQAFKPDLVLYDAGVDVHTRDALGRLDISDEGLWRREMLVLDTCVGFGAPVAGYVGGGYDDDLDVLADRHICLHRAATEVWHQNHL